MRRRWIPISPEGWHAIIAGLIRDRQLELAIDAVQHLQKEGIDIQPWLYDIILYNLCDLEEFDEVLKIIQHRVSSGELTISAAVWFYFLDTASRALHHPATIYVWNKRVEPGYLNPPSGVCTNVLSTAARYGDFRLATDVFRVLGNRGQTFRMHHYESLLEAYLAAADLKTALGVLCVMTSSGYPPTESSTRPVLAYLKQSPSFPIAAVLILCDLRDADRPISVPVINVIIEAFVFHEDTASALETYKKLHLLSPEGPSTATFNALLRGCSRDADIDLAMFLASEMLALSVRPDALTYDRLILVCLSAAKAGVAGAYDDAWRYFGEMRASDWWPRLGTLSLMATRALQRQDQRAWGLGWEEGMSGGLRHELLPRLAQEYWPEGWTARMEEKSGTRD